MTLLIPYQTEGNPPKGSDRRMAALPIANWVPKKAMLICLIAVLCCALVIFGSILLPIFASGNMGYLGVMGFAHTDSMVGDHLYTMDMEHDEHYALVMHEQHANPANDRTANAVIETLNPAFSTDYARVELALESVDTTALLYLAKNIIGSSE